MNCTFQKGQDKICFTGGLITHNHNCRFKIWKKRYKYNILANTILTKNSKSNIILLHNFIRRLIIGHD